MSAEQAIGIAHKMYQCRRTLRQLFSSNYQSQVLPYMKAVNEYAEKHGIPLMSATLRLAQGLQMDGHKISVMWVMAAAVEIVEPDSETPSLETECAGK